MMKIRFVGFVLGAVLIGAGVAVTSLNPLYNAAAIVAGIVLILQWVAVLLEEMEQMLGAYNEDRSPYR